MSTPANPEVKELSPVDFIQLQQYIECEYGQGGGGVGGQRSQLNTTLHTLRPTHTVISTQPSSCFEAVAVCAACTSLRVCWPGLEPGKCQR